MVTMQFVKQIRNCTSIFFVNDHLYHYEKILNLFKIPSNTGTRHLRAVSEHNHFLYVRNININFDLFIGL